MRHWPGWHRHRALSLVASWFSVIESRRGKKDDARVDRAAGASGPRRDPAPRNPDISYACRPPSGVRQINTLCVITGQWAGPSLPPRTLPPRPPAGRSSHGQVFPPLNPTPPLRPVADPSHGRAPPGTAPDTGDGSTDGTPPDAPSPPPAPPLRTTSAGSSPPAPAPAPSPPRPSAATPAPARPPPSRAAAGTGSPGTDGRSSGPPTGPTAAPRSDPPTRHAGKRYPPRIPVAHPARLAPRTAGPAPAPRGPP